MNPINRGLVALASAMAIAAAHADAPSVEVIATGLNNPRGLGFSPNGFLYVAEAGSGGPGNCRASPDGQPVEVCYGETGALTRIDPSGQKAPRRVLGNLPSMAAAGGFAAASGPVDVQFSGANAFVVMGWGGDPALRAGLGAKSRLFGTLLLVTPNGLSFPVTDIAANELQHNPAGGPVDSNPYGVLVLPDRRIVADAGANALIRSGPMDLVLPNSDRSFAVLPPTAFGTEAVPTTVVKGPGGDLYVGQLTGAPFFRGSSTIYRVPRSGGTAVPYLTGLTAVVDMAFDDTARCTFSRSRADSCRVPARIRASATGGCCASGRIAQPRSVDGLVFPAGVAIGPDGVIYVSNFGIFPGGGEILRVTLD